MRGQLLSFTAGAVVATSPTLGMGPVEIVVGASLDPAASPSRCATVSWNVATVKLTNAGTSGRSCVDVDGILLTNGPVDGAPW